MEGSFLLLWNNLRPYEYTRQYSLKEAGPTVWNNLPADIISVPLVHLLKRASVPMCLGLLTMCLNTITDYRLFCWLISCCLALE